MYSVKECQEIYDFLIEYRERSLPLLERIKFKIHLWMCDSCASYLKIYHHSSDLFRAALQEKPPPDALLDLTMDFVRNRRKSDS